MTRFLLLITVSLLALTGYTQNSYPVTYQALREYEGLYRFMDNSTLTLAASPKDSILYALFHNRPFPLSATGKDVFLDVSRSEVRFYRNVNGSIAGYIAHKDSFPLLDKNVIQPITRWYPRMNAAWQYKTPDDLHDGLPVGSTQQAGLDTTILSRMVRKIIAGDYPDVHSILILKEGRLVSEEYFYQYTRDSLHELRSATKSFVSALTGIAINKGYLKSVNESVVSWFPEYRLQNQSPLKSRITVANMLANASGLDCDITNPHSAGDEEVMDHSDDWVKFTLDLPMLDSPGITGRYCSGNPITIGRVLEKATRQPLPQFAKKYLFTPLGIQHYQWDFHPNRSNAEEYCQLYLRPRDIAKFAVLYLDQGKWKGQQVIPASWVQDSWKKHSVVEGIDYGYLWWLKYLDAGGVRIYGKAAQGNGGQKIYIWPDLHMAVVITAGSYNRQSSSDLLISTYILPALQAKTALAQ